MVTWFKLWKIKPRACIHAFVLFPNKVDDQRFFVQKNCDRLDSVHEMCKSTRTHEYLICKILKCKQCQAFNLFFILNANRLNSKRQKIRTHERRVLNSNKKIRSSSHERRSRWNAINGWTEHACYTHVDILIQFGTVWNVILKDIQQAVVWIARIYSKSMCVFFNSLTKLW